MARRGITACDGQLAAAAADWLPQRTQPIYTHANSPPHVCAVLISNPCASHSWNVMLCELCAFAGLLCVLCTRFGSWKFRGVAREADLDLKLGPIRFGNAFAEWTIDDEWPAAGSIFRLRVSLSDRFMRCVKGEMRLCKLHFYVP